MSRSQRTHSGIENQLVILLKVGLTDFNWTGAEGTDLLVKPKEFFQLLFGVVAFLK